MSKLRFYQGLKRFNLLGLVRRIFHYDDWIVPGDLTEVEKVELWYENKCYEMLEDMNRQAKLYSVSMTAIDSQGNRIIDLEEQARGYRAQIRNLHAALEEAYNEVCEDTKEKVQDLAMP